MQFETRAGGVEALAAEVENQTARLLSVLRALPDPHAVPEGEQRGAATLGLHVAEGEDQALRWLRGVLHNGKLVDVLDRDTINELNAEHAAARPAPTLEEVTVALETASAEVVRTVRSIGDDFIDTESENEMLGRRWTLRELCELAIRHIRVHTDAVASVAALR